MLLSPPDAGFKRIYFCKHFAGRKIHSANIVIFSAIATK
jgi:hypothetical protein